MIKHHEAQPIAAMCLAIGILLGAVAFFSFVYLSSRLNETFIADNNASSPNNQLPVVELQRQAGRTPPAGAIRM